MTSAELTARIANTNNGYIFAPTAEELWTAMTDPTHFTVIPNSFGSFTIASRKSKFA
jgi:hypothetical protein